MKKLLLFIAATLFVTVMNAAVVDNGRCGSNLTWQLTDNGTLTISGEGLMDNFEWANSPWYSYGDDILRVVISERVTSIGVYAFAGCHSLESVKIPVSVTNISARAFYGCRSLKSIDIPRSVNSISERVFYGCSSLTNIEIPGSVMSIDDCAFYGCSLLENVEIPESVTSIGSSAFYNCRSLKTVMIPGSVTSIGSAAFYDCNSLVSVEIMEGITSIGGAAFADCNSLMGIKIPKSVTSIEAMAFYGCWSVEYIISMNSQPPHVSESWDSWTGINKNIPVYVPKESIGRYSSSDSWDYFTNFLPLEELGGDEPGGSAVEETEADGIALKITTRDGRIYCEEEFRIVNLAGQDVTAMNGELQGTYIVVSGDKAVKVVVD